ncbi:MAG: NADH-quinone oxidoreductase subunit N [Candidatus Marinimicrobia bacterium]|nr:NADH-quinone oxidoreductase subunit N [Candidatus Neomarinimicrobiota bacterium]
MDNIQSLKLFIPEFVILATIVVAVLSDMIYSRKNSHRVGYWVFCGLVLSAFTLFLSDPEIITTLFLNTIALDPFARVFKFIFLFITAIIILISLRSDELTRVSKGEYFILISVMVLGMFLMASAIDLVMIYLSIEVVSITSFILAGYLKTQVRSTEASLKYVIYGAFSSGIMLYGMSLLFGLTGTTKILEMRDVMAGLSGGTNLTLLISVIFILAGFGYKIAAVPFHFWTPDVYEGAPTPMTAFFSVAPKAAGFAMLIRVYNSIFSVGNALNANVWQAIDGLPWPQIIALVSAITMTLGNLVAIQQSNIKRLLAYSSIAHAGYILMGIPVLSKQGIEAIVFYIVVYLFMQLGAFFVAILISNKYNTEEIEEYTGLGYKTPFLGLVMALFLFSLTGIPPTAGFIGKFYLFAALIKAGPSFYWLVMLGVVNSVISLYYYMRILRRMYFMGKPAKELYVPSYGTVVILLVLAIPTLVFGVYWVPIINWVHDSLIFFVANI